MTAARLLVVDDHDMNREVLRRRFGRAGHAVEAVGGGREALDRLAAQPFDLVLLDIEMPGLTGLDVLREVRARHSPAELPVVMVSARHDSEMIVEALRLGANDYITKPVDFAVARARVDAQLARRIDAERRAGSRTGLPNRRAIPGWWARHAWTDRPVAALWLNLDRFRVVNGGLGRAAGDRLLAGVAARLRALAPSEALLVHLDADDFLLLAPDLPVEEAGALAARILDDLRRPFALGDQAVTAKASIGIACGANRPADDLMAEADAALYRAKSRSGGTWEVFDQELRSRAAERLRLEIELQEALEAGAFELCYQPIVELATGAIAGFEALARWRHPTRGEVLPAAFIPVAEESGLIAALDRQVLRRACERLRRWQDEGRLLPPRGLSVNVSGLPLRDPAWVDTVGGILADTGVDPRGLTLEITESVLLEDAIGTAEILRRARTLGIDLALDDFGTGYSSLSYLQQFALNALKVDRSFVARLTGAGGGPEVVRAILQLASSFGLSVVAEGIESAEQLERLQALGCPFGQGFFLSRPLSAGDAERLLTPAPPVTA